jgi:selenide, water dikinase
MKTLIFVGAGHSNLVAIKELAGALPPEVKIVLVSDVLMAPYSGMLPGFMAGYYQENQIVFDLEKMARTYKIRFIHAQVKNISTESNTIRLSSGEEINYNCLSVNTGILPQQIECDQQSREYLIYAKPLSHFIPKWNLFLKEKKVLKVAIIGAGSAGCEVATAIALRKMGEVTLFTNNQEILTELPKSARNKALLQLEKLNIQIQTYSQVDSYKTGKIFLDKGKSFSADYAFVTTGAMPNPIPGDLKCDENGFVITNDRLLVEGTKNVFAAGDCISFNRSPLPKAGVYAVRQGKILEKNIKAYFFCKPMIPYKPQTRFLKILLTGNRTALATRGALSVSGKLCWILKVFLDKKFMKKYQSR